MKAFIYKKIGMDIGIKPFSIYRKLFVYFGIAIAIKYK